jgi:L-iditol 2-dehydrogenase
VRQAVLKSPRVIALEERPVPDPGAGEVLLRVRAALTCGTDLKTYRRGHPRLPVGPFGHECAGDVVAVGPGVQDVAPGDAVMFVPTAPCGVCPACRAGAENHCERLFRDIVLGAYADYLLVSPPVAARHLLPKPPHLSYIEAAFLEPLACVLHGWRRLALTAPATVAVVGLGSIGLLQVLTGQAMGHRLAAVGRRPERLRLAAALGAAPIEIEQGEIPAQVVDALGVRPDAVIESTGTPYIWERAPEWVRPGGKVLLFGGLAGGSAVTFDAGLLHYSEIDLVSAFHYTPADVAEAQRWLGERRVDVRPIISAVRPLDDIVGVFAELDRGGPVKVAIMPEAAEWC